MTNDVRIGVQADTSGAEGSLDRLEGKAEKIERKINRTTMAGPRAEPSQTPGGHQIGAAAFLADEKLRAQLTERIRQNNAGIRQETEATAKAMEKAAKAAREWLDLSKTRPGATQFEGEAMASAFATRQRHNPMMAGFDDISAWSNKVRERFSSKEDADQHMRDEVKRMTGLAFGTSLQGHAGRAERFAGALGGFAGGMMTGGGGMYGTIGAGIGGLLGTIPGAGMILGPIAGPVLGALGGQVDRGMGEATEESIGTANLRHALGDASAEFDNLRANVRAAAEGMGVANAEAVKLGRQFSHNANLSGPAGAEALFGELRNAMGFSRGFGLEPGVGVDFFSKMRMMKVGIDEKSGKRLGLDVAESIARGGNFAKADEVLQSISNFAAQATRIATDRPDVEKFAWLQAIGSRHGTPGLDASGTASVLTTADAAIRHGGAYGEASQYLLAFSMAQRIPGLSVFDAKIMQQGGFFATPEQRFGKESAAYRYAESTGNQAEMARLEKLAKSSPGKPELGWAVVQDLERLSMGNQGLFAETLSNTLGLGSMDKAFSLAQWMHQGDERGVPGGGLSARLEHLGVPVEKADWQVQATLADIYFGDRDKLKSYASKAREGMGMKALSEDERKQLQRAEGGSDDALKDALLKIYAVGGRQETPGDETLTVQTDLRNKFADFSAEMLKIETDIRGGVLELVKAAAPDSAFVKRMEQAEWKEREAKLSTTTDPDERRRLLTEQARLGVRHWLRGDWSFGDGEGKAPASAVPETNGPSAGGRPVSKPSLGANEGAMSRAAGPAGTAGTAEMRLPQSGSPSGKSFYSAYYADALAAAKEAGIDNPERAAKQALMQAALETGHGKKVIPGTNNVGNVKAGSSWRGQTVKAYDKAEGSTDPYRVYASPKDSFSDMFAQPRFRDLWGREYRDWATGMQDRKWATDADYGKKLLGMRIPDVPPLSDAAKRQGIRPITVAQPAQPKASPPPLSEAAKRQGIRPITSAPVAATPRPQKEDPDRVKVPKTKPQARPDKVASAQRVEHVHTIVIRDQAGNALGDPITLSSLSDRPTPSGAFA